MNHQVHLGQSAHVGPAFQGGGAVAASGGVTWPLGAGGEWVANVSFNGLGVQAPQMGWNSWNSFACDISETTILDAARVLVESGLKDRGYTYVVIDDCWQASGRDEDGRPKADPERFASGMRSLADKVHEMGLKIGIYSSAGTHTCAGRYGSLGYEEVDAQQYAEWTFDYLKYDNCHSAGQFGTPLVSYERYKRMSDAMVGTGRDIWYSMCNWGQDQAWNWATSISNSYRMSGDIDDTFDEAKTQCPETANTVAPEGYGCSVANILSKAGPILQKQVRGSWLDLDMLEVGRGGMTTDEYIVHFSMWALIKSSLILGNDLSQMNDLTLSILSNQAIIDIHQNPHGGPNPLSHISGGFGEVQVWRGVLQDGAFVVAIVNFTPKDVTLDVDFKSIFRDDGKSVQTSIFRPVDLWSAKYFPHAESLVEEHAFGANDVGETVGGSLKGVEVRKKAGRFWRFELVE